MGPICTPWASPKKTVSCIWNQMAFKRGMRGFKTAGQTGRVEAARQPPASSWVRELLFPPRGPGTGQCCPARARGILWPQQKPTLTTPAVGCCSGKNAFHLSPAFRILHKGTVLAETTLESSWRGSWESAGLRLLGWECRELLRSGVGRRTFAGGHSSAHWLKGWLRA